MPVFPSLPFPFAAAYSNFFPFFLWDFHNWWKVGEKLSMGLNQCNTELQWLLVFQNSCREWVVFLQKVVIFFILLSRDWEEQVGQANCTSLITAHARVFNVRPRVCLDIKISLFFKDLLILYLQLLLAN